MPSIAFGCLPVECVPTGEVCNGFDDDCDDDCDDGVDEDCLM